MRSNNEFPSEAAIERLRTIYSAGCRVELIAMEDPYADLQPGVQGTVQYVDDIGTIFVDWDCGSGLGVVYGVDHVRRI